MRAVKLILGVSILLSVGCAKGCNANKAGASVFFANLKDGAEVSTPIKIKMGLQGMELRPAGEDVTDQLSGHHHIIIDSPDGFIPKGQVIPADSRHIHFGKAQSEATVELPRGKHRLSLQLADGAHISYGKPLSASIHITVH